ncbi:hypothetical protein SAMN05216436_101272 [bacterium A37T11]|nr:hypothetical protein SAMN05216436_101272 [bacterium A37T11]
MVNKFFICIALLCMVKTTNAQVKGQLSVAGALNYNTQVERIGLSGSIKWLAPQLGQVDRGLVVSLKSTYTPSENGFFKGGSERIAALHILAGYRQQWLMPNLKSLFYAELSGGLTAIGKDFELSPGVQPLVGYNLDKHWGAFTDYHRSFAGNDKKEISLIELGITYTFGI